MYNLIQSGSKKNFLVMPMDHGITNLEDPITKLKRKVTELTDAQQKVADYIIKNPVDVAFLTVDQLAGIVGTSTTTIIRLTYSLGYSGYSEFQRGLQDLIRNRADPNTRLTASLRELEEKDLWIRCMENAVSNIQITANMVSKETLETALQMIHAAERIYCTAIRSAIPVAQGLSYGLSRLLGKGDLLVADWGTWTEKVINFTSGDLVIAISFPRYGRKVVEFIKATKEYGGKVISITDSYFSPLVKYSDLVIPCQVSSVAFHNSILAPMFIVDYLISSVAIRDPESTKKRFEKIDSLLIDMNYHILHVRKED